VRLKAMGLPSAESHHPQHLEVAFFYIRRYGCTEGSLSTFRAIEADALHLGHADRFHATLTICWIRLIAATLVVHPDCCTLDALLLRHPVLLDKHLPRKFYSQPLLDSDRARRGWTEPDLRPLPATF